MVYRVYMVLNRGVYSIVYRVYMVYRVYRVSTFILHKNNYSSINFMSILFLM